MNTDKLDINLEGHIEVCLNIKEHDINFNKTYTFEYDDGDSGTTYVFSGIKPEKVEYHPDKARFILDAKDIIEIK